MRISPEQATGGESLIICARLAFQKLCQLRSGGPHFEGINRHLKTSKLVLVAVLLHSHNTLTSARSVLLQEFQYNIPRPLYYAQLFKAARKAKAVAMLPWELCPWHVAKNDSGGFDFGVDDPSFVPISDAIAHQHAMVRFKLNPRVTEPAAYGLFSLSRSALLTNTV